MQYILEQGVCHGTVFNSCHTSFAAEKNPLILPLEPDDARMGKAIPLPTKSYYERVVSPT